METNEIKQFFANMRSDIKNAKTYKTLVYLESHAKQYLQRLKDPALKPSIKKMAMKEFKRLQKDLKARQKQL